MEKIDVAMKKIKVFLDADDTILESSKTVIDILNREYGGSKTIQDLKDWNYKTVCWQCTKDKVIDIYDSDEFFDNVKLSEEFINVYNKYMDDFDFYIVTKGTFKNLTKKKQFFKKHLPKVTFIDCPMYEEDFSKKDVNMNGGIQIDDRYDCLDTNAPCKILLKNNLDLPWNNYKGGYDNVYIVNDWKEIEKYFEFTIKNPTWFE